MKTRATFYVAVRKLFRPEHSLPCKYIISLEMKENEIGIISNETFVYFYVFYMYFIFSYMDRFMEFLFIFDVIYSVGSMKIK